MKLVDVSLKRPVTVFMVTLGVMIFGLVAASRLSVDLLPDISYPSLTIRTDLRDAAPEDVEQFVTRPVEEAVGVVAGLTRMHSISRPGQSEVTLEFGSGTRMDLAALAVREKLDLVTLPREAARPAILRFDPSLDPILRLRFSGSENLQRLRRIADRTIKTELEATPGVAAVRVSGGEEEEIQVDVDAARLSALGLTLADVTRRLGDENVNLAGGSLTEGQAEYLIRATNQFLDPNEISNVILASRPNGVIRVSDVATVRRGPKDREVVARVGGKEAVELAVYKEGDANTVAVARAVKHRVDKMQLGSEYKLVTVADQSRFIENSINEVINSAWQGGLLAVLVLFLFLRNLRTTLIIALSIPISVFATFVIMYRFGISLNLMSLGGLALAVGMLVDNSIVVLESIFRKREEGLNKKQAASQGAGMVAMAVTASTLTTVAVFLPLVFVEGLAGQLLRDQALTISFSLLASLAVALTIVPTLAGLGGGGQHETQGAAIPAAIEEASVTQPKRSSFTGTLLRYVLFGLLFLPRLLVRGISWLGHTLEPSVNRALDRFHDGYEYLIHGYPTLLRRVLARPQKTLTAAALLFVGALAVGFFLPRNLFPPFTQGEFHFNIRLPEGTALAVTDQTLERLERVARQDPRVKLAYTSAGQTDLSAFAGSAREANRGQVAVLMKKATDRKAEEAVADELRDEMSQIPGLTYEFERPALLTFKNPVEVEVYAYDLDTLRVAANDVADRLEHIRGLADVESSVRSGDPEVQVTFDRARLAAMNLDPAQASRLVRNAVQGEAATQFSDLDRKLDVRVRADESQRSVVSELGNLEVGRNNGQPVLLGATADVQVKRGPGEVRRISQQRAAVISANLAGRDLGSASKEIQATLADMHLPGDARVVLAGQNQELAQSFSSLRFALLLAVFLVYLVMASQFESLLHPFVIMFGLPLAVVGVVVALVVSLTSVSVMVLIGMIVLAGIVVSQGIVLLDYTNRLRKKGMPKVDALVEAGMVRMRPILMTKLTILLGVIPMALSMGEGAEMRAPLAITLIGGIAGATILTLFVIPAVYVTLDRRP
ncbi:MAG TPA: efflux RND transporter permease subunit [Candidatus Eisenbacteria bacterium]|nr:efflux RND transporter permease subunit [Candidatus Eisenbacteria bacterium]